jgi:hypothetical protein
MTSNPAAEARGPARPVQVLSGMEVGVIGVAATRTQPCAAWTAMDDYAELISDRTPIRAVRLPLPRSDAGTVVARIANLPWPVSAVFLVGLGPSAAATVQRRLADQGGPLVITELDLITVAMAAAAMGTLRRQGIVPRQGRIVVTDAEYAPRLGPTILAASGGSVTGWHERDAATYPLCRVMFRNDVLIDLAGTTPHSVAPGRILTLPSTLFDYGQLVLPGLLSALCGRGETRLTLDTLACCVRALALVTPSGKILPDLDQRLLIPAITRRVARTLDLPTPSKHPQCWPTMASPRPDPTA